MIQVFLDRLNYQPALFGFGHIWYIFYLNAVYWWVFIEALEAGESGHFQPLWSVCDLDVFVPWDFSLACFRKLLGFRSTQPLVPLSDAVEQRLGRNRPTITCLVFECVCMQRR